MKKSRLECNSWWNILMLVLVCGLNFHCGGEDSSTADDDLLSEDAGSEGCPDGGTNCLEVEEAIPVPESTVESCPGYSEKPNFPESYQTFCEQMVTQELIDSGDKCFFAPEVVDSGCYCKICAIKGIALRCVHEVCL